MKFGPFLKAPSPFTIEVLAISGCELAVFDMEHSPYGFQELYPCLLAAEKHGLELMVRLPSLDETAIKKCLDLGVQTLLIPHISSPEHVEMAHRWARFHPDGQRGLCRFVRAAKFGQTESKTYTSLPPARLIFQIEGQEGIQNLDAIIQVPGVTSIFLGPYDLSQSLGLPGEIWHPEVAALMAHSIEKCHAKNITVGTFTDSEEGLAHWRRLDFITYGSDLALLADRTKQLRAILDQE